MARQSGDGLPVWYDLISIDPQTTDTFYTELFGWDVDAVSDRENGYRYFDNDIEAFGGTLPIDASMGASTWATYFQVTELDELTANAEKLGASIYVPRTSVPEIGDWAFLADPTGAPFYLFELDPQRRWQSTGYHTGHGHVIWNELITTDVAGATDFYRQLLGWELVPTAPGQNPYTVAKVDGSPVGGLFQPATPPAHSMWIVSFETGDIDATIDRVRKLGGTVVHPANTVPGIGRTAWVADPTGAVFGLMQPEPGWLDRLA
ncbi:MAG: VOC family protein [Thermomicrobiales bacterium]|nr:VOC family protein [Thermomicrobiales bacterium]MCO5223202.1 VOC family protein [Thermomicrobiales bacterium]